MKDMMKKKSTKRNRKENTQYYREHKYTWDEWQQLFVCVHGKKCNKSNFTPQEAASIINQLSEQGFYFQ